MSERRQPGPLAILFGVTGLLLLTIVAFFVAMVITGLALEFLGLEDEASAQKGLSSVILGLVMFPVIMGWGKFFSWCGVVLPGKDTKR